MLVMTQRKPLLLFMMVILCDIVLPSTGFGETVRVAICQIDDVRLYTRALSDAEIAALVPGAAVNEAPRINAGQDTMSSTIDVSLHGVFSDEGGPSTGVTARWTVWRKVSGPGEVYFDEPYELITTASFERPGAYVLELQGSDGGHLVRDTTVITIQDSDQE